MRRPKGTIPLTESIRNLEKALKELYKTPTAVDAGFKEALTLALVTQGRLAAFSWEEKKISGMSLNTQKQLADNELAGGFTALNALRKAAKLKLDKLDAAKTAQGRSPKRETIPWYQNELAQTRKMLAQVTDELFTMSQRLDMVVAFAYDAAVYSGQREFFSKVLAELTLKFKSTDSLKALYSQNIDGPKNG